MRKEEVIPCVTYAWCLGHDEGSEAREDPHLGNLEAATASESSVQLWFSESLEGNLEFQFDLDWTFTPGTIDAEFADIRTIIDKLQAQAHEFHQRHEISARERALDAILDAVKR